MDFDELSNDNEIRWNLNHHQSISRGTYILILEHIYITWKNTPTQPLTSWMSSLTLSRVFDCMPVVGILWVNVSRARMDFRWFLVDNCIDFWSTLIIDSYTNQVDLILNETLAPAIVGFSSGLTRINTFSVWA
jgi:hypothetical protein